MNIKKKIVQENKKSWDGKIKYSLFANRTTTKTYTKKTYFELVYGMEAQFPMNIQIPSLQLVQTFSTNKEELQGRIDQLMELYEAKRITFDQMVKNQDKFKGDFDQKERPREFKEGD